MGSLEPPGYGTPEPQQSATPARALRLFEARHEPRDAVAIVLVGGIGAVVTCTGAAFLAGFVMSGSVLGDDAPFSVDTGMFTIVPMVMLVFFAGFGVMLAGATVSGLVRTLRRRLIVRIDADGVLLERRRWWGSDRLVPWSAVRGLSAYSTTQRDDDGPSTTHWFQVDLIDGTIERRRLDRRRYSWAALAEAVRAVSPRTALTVEGELPSPRES